MALPAAKTATSRKAGPGRPRLPRPGAELLMEGVVAAPKDPASRMELDTIRPELFKMAFGYFKRLKSLAVRMEFARDGLTLFARDDSNRLRVVARVEGANMNRYFCAEPFSIVLMRNNADQAFLPIDKSTFYRVLLRIERTDAPHLEVVLYDKSLQKQCRYEIPTVRPEVDDELLAARAELSAERIAERPLSFKLPAKKFGKTVATIEKLKADKVFLTLTGAAGSLKISGTGSTGMKYEEVYADATKIALQTQIQANEAFRLGIPVGIAKSVAGAPVDDLQVYATETGSTVFRAGGPWVQIDTLASFD